MTLYPITQYDPLPNYPITYPHYTTYYYSTWLTHFQRPN